MKTSYIPQNFPQAAKNIRALLNLSDAEFAEKYLNELSQKEREEFLRECPEFPSDLLRAK